MSADQVHRYHPHILLVPSPLWGMNMRELMSQRQWTKFRKALVEHDGLTCRTCGKVETESRHLSAHEEWQYDEEAEPATALLADVSLVCRHCHRIEHWGLTNNFVAQGRLTQRDMDDLIAHFCRLNNATKADFSAHEEQAMRDWTRRNGRKWRIDYGPFLEWVVATYEQDPFSDEAWSKELETRWAEAPTPSLNQLILVLRPPT